MLLLGNMQNITIINKFNSYIFTTYDKDIEKMDDKKFIMRLLKYLKIGFNRTIPLKYLIRKIYRYNNKYHKLATTKDLTNIRNEQDIFSMEELKDVPKKRLILIEKIVDTYNGFDVIQLRKFLFDDKKEKYINPLTTNKISEEDMDKILKADIKCIKYFS